MNKLTNKMVLNMFRGALENGMAFSTEFSNDEILAKVDKMLEALDKKGNESAKTTENNKMNEEFKARTLDFLADGKHATATEVLQAVPEMKSNQRASSVLRALRLDGKVEKETVKGKSLFFIA